MLEGTHGSLRTADSPMFELKYDWSRRFQFEFEWIELTIVDNKLGRNGQLAGAGKERSGGEYGTWDTARGILQGILDALDTRY